MGYCIVFRYGDILYFWKMIRLFRNKINKIFMLKDFKKGLKWSKTVQI